MNLRNLPSRLGSSSVIVVGIAGVVAVLVSILAMATGFRAALESTGAPDRAIVLRGGSGGELSSGMSQEVGEIVSQMEGILVASGELYSIADVPNAVTVRRPIWSFAASDRTHSPCGPNPHRHGAQVRARARASLIAGRRASEEFSGIDLGSTLRFATVIGRSSEYSKRTETSTNPSCGRTSTAYRQPCGVAVPSARCGSS